MQDEELSAREACDMVLQDNLFGLEIDARCTQIAAFALALAAWKYPNAGGYRPLPTFNIACSGQGVTGKKDEWMALANGDSRLRFSLGSLYDLFRQAPHLGSLINPRSVEGAAGITGTFAELQPLLSKALAKSGRDADLAAMGVAAQGIARAAELLARRYTLIATNVPYLGYKRQSPVLRQVGEDHFQAGKADLATMFVQRIIQLTAEHGYMAIVTPRYWMFLHSYTDLRKLILSEYPMRLLAFLGPNSFETISGEIVNVSLVCIHKSLLAANHSVWSVDGTPEPNPQRKDVALRTRGMSQIPLKK